MFIRRVFYDLSTGEVLRNVMAEGLLSPDYPPNVEADAFGLTNWGVFEWAEYDPVVEAQFAPFDTDGNARTVVVNVDVSVSPHRLVFAYSPDTEV